jgi:hypothetical protein
VLRVDSTRCAATPQLLYKPAAPCPGPHCTRHPASYYTGSLVASTGKIEFFVGSNGAVASTEYTSLAASWSGKVARGASVVLGSTAAAIFVRIGTTRVRKAIFWPSVIFHDQVQNTSYFIMVALLLEIHRRFTQNDRYVK